MVMVAAGTGMVVSAWPRQQTADTGWPKVIRFLFKYSFSEDSLKAGPGQDSTKDTLHRKRDQSPETAILYMASAITGKGEFSEIFGCVDQERVILCG